MAHDVFLSHSSKDKAVADAVCAKLEESSLRCWIAPRDIRPGSEWSESIVKAIENCRVMVLIFSENANQSPQIIREVERAVNKRIAIVPFRIEDVMPSKSLEYFISTPHWLDALTPPLEKHIEYLIATVRAILDPTKSLPRSQSIASTSIKNKLASRQLPPWVRDRRILGGAAATLLLVLYLVFRTPAPVESVFVGSWQTKLPITNANIRQKNGSDGRFAQSVFFNEVGTLFTKNGQYFMRTESGAERMISWAAKSSQSAEITSLVPNEVWSQIAFASTPGYNVMQEISANAGKTLWTLQQTKPDGTQVWLYEPIFDQKKWSMRFEVGRDGKYRFAAELHSVGRLRARDGRYSALVDNGVPLTGEFEVIDENTISVTTPTGPIVWRRASEDN